MSKKYALPDKHTLNTRHTQGGQAYSRRVILSSVDTSNPAIGTDDEKQPPRHGPGRTSPARGADAQSAMLAEWLAFLDELLSYSPRQERVASVGPLSRYPAD